MAILTSDELGELRHNCEKAGTVTYTKIQINSIIQAVENWFETNKSSLNTTINTAASPLVLTVQQKRYLIAYYLKQKFIREGV